VVHEPVLMVRVQARTRCACGEGMGPGDRAGRINGRGKLLCLWCLADLRAGRPRPRRRATASAWPVPAAGQRHTTAARRSTSGRRRWTAALLAASVSVAIGALYLQSHLFGASASTTAHGLHIPGTHVVIGDGSSLVGQHSRGARGLWPPVPSDASTHPLGAPPASASSSREFAFMRTVSGSDRPVAWDPCRPIHLVINDMEQPVGGQQLVEEAAAQVSAATGLRLVIDGPTAETPSTGRGPVDTERYGDRWSPVLVAWTDPSVIPRLAGRVAGLAGPAGAPFSSPDEEHWVSGEVNLDGPDFAEILRRPGGWPIARAIVMHELGHLVGLSHVPDAHELMDAENTGQIAFGPGDREGLRQLGLGSCFTD